MSLRDEVLAVHDAIHGPSCTVGKMLARMDAALAAEVVELLDDPDVPKVAIEKALRARGIAGVPRAQTLARHQRKDCACG